MAAVTFFYKDCNVIKFFLPMNPIQTFIRRLLTKDKISDYCWTLTDSNQGLKEGLQMEEEGEQYRETQASWAGAMYHSD